MNVLDFHQIYFKITFFSAKRDATSIQSRLIYLSLFLRKHNHTQLLLSLLIQMVSTQKVQLNSKQLQNSLKYKISLTSQKHLCYSISSINSQKIRSTFRKISKNFIQSSSPSPPGIYLRRQQIKFTLNDLKVMNILKNYIQQHVCTL